MGSSWFCCLGLLLLEEARSLLRAYSAVGARRLAVIQVRLSARSCADFEAISDPLEESIGKVVWCRQAGKWEPDQYVLSTDL